MNNNSNQLRPDLSLRLISWNVKSEQPKCDLTQLLDIQTSDDQTDNRSVSPLADIYVIGLQEVPFRATNIIFTDPWIESYNQVFKQIDYIRLKSVRLVGILLLVYTKRQNLPKFRSIETQYTRTGLGGFWGNKGGVSVSLVIDGVSICLMNSHLAAHLENLEQRISDYNTIVDNQYFVNTRKPNILSHDYVLWIGDLNFRIDDLTGDEIHDIILNATQTDGSVNSNIFAQLLDNDQLKTVRREGRAFSEFSETAPTFAPTYKFFVNTDSYDYKSRKPAYTDRILYRFTPNAYESLKLDLKQTEYKSIPQYKQSDHKPVSATFHLKTKKSINRLINVVKRSAKPSPPVPSLGLVDVDQIVGTDYVDGEQPIFVTFHTITDWKVNKDSTAWYTITPNSEDAIAQLSAWDYIGLYKSDFLSIDEYVSFVWANPLPTRWSSPDSQTDNTSQSSDEEDGQQSESTGAREPWFSVQYSDQMLLIADEFRLVYVSQNGDVLGISDTFVVTNN